MSAPHAYREKLADLRLSYRFRQVGARRADVLRMVMTEAARLLLIGMIAGSVLVLASARYSASLLLGLKPTDPAMLLLAVLGLTLTAALASFLPARRAAAMEPTNALRVE